MVKCPYCGKSFDETDLSWDYEEGEFTENNDYLVTSSIWCPHCDKHLWIQEHYEFCGNIEVRKPND